MSFACCLHDVCLWQVVNHPKQILLKKEADRAIEASRAQSAAYAGAEFAVVRAHLAAPEPGSAGWRRENELRQCVGEALVSESVRE